MRQQKKSLSLLIDKTARLSYEMDVFQCGLSARVILVSSTEEAPFHPIVE